VLYLPRLAVFVSLEADRPGTCFPGPLGPYLPRFSGIGLNRDFERVKEPVNPMESPFCLSVFLEGHFPKKNIFAGRQPNHVKHWLSGLNKLLKGNFHSMGSAPGDPRGACYYSTLSNNNN
jgi:hypothetical protein